MSRGNCARVGCAISVTTIRCVPLTSIRMRVEHSYACRIDQDGRRAANQRRRAIPLSLRGRPADCEARDVRDSARVGSG
jgi:hypothetical protein